MAIIISNKTETKLNDKHSVTKDEVQQCFQNVMGSFLTDNREEHKTDPETMWFISLTNKNRPLKVVFIFKDNNIIIKTAYPPNKDEIEIYLAKG